MRIMLFDGQGLLEPANFNQSNYAVKVLTQRDNMARKLFQDKDNMRTEWTADISDGGRVKAVPKIDAVYTHFQDRVERECHILEQMFAYQARTSAPGKALRFTPRQYLEGYDFMDVATAQDPLYPKALKIDYKGRGWVDFTRAINAVTLFGRGFGELAKPSSSSNALCRTWGTVPTQQTYLTVCISDLEQIMERRGDQDPYRIRLVENIFWHKPDKLYEACSCNAAEDACERVQVFLPGNLKLRRPQHPGNWRKPGAVVFGQSRKYRLIWRDRGESEEGDLSGVNEEADDSFHDSGLGSSVGQLNSTEPESTNLSYAPSNRSQVQNTGGQTVQGPRNIGSPTLQPACQPLAKKEKRGLKLIRRLFRKPASSSP